MSTMLNICIKRTRGMACSNMGKCQLSGSLLFTKVFELIGTAYTATFSDMFSATDNNWLTQFSIVVQLGNEMKLKLRQPPLFLIVF